MEIRVPADVQAKLVHALQRAGRQEIGGILMGECLAPNRFQVADLTIQSRGGTFATFVRNLLQAVGPLRRFFARTGHQYRRFNYLGEWHSHPSFPPKPSTCDVQSMVEIVEDLSVGATFAVLLIVRLNAGEQIEGTVTVFVPGQPASFGELVLEPVA